MGRSIVWPSTRSRVQIHHIFRKKLPWGALAAQQQQKPFPSVLFILCNNSILLIYGLNIPVTDRLLKYQWMGQEYINILAAMAIYQRLC